MRKYWLRKMLVLALVSTLLISVAACAGNTTQTTGTTQATTGTTKAAAGGKATLWTWDVGTEEPVVKDFVSANPGYSVELVAVGYDDYMNKVQTSIASGSELGDILLGELGFRARLFNLNVLDNLESAPYSFDRSKLLSYVVPVLSYKDHLVGLDGSITAGGLAYKTALVKQYLGINDVDTMEKTLNTWDAMIDAAKKVQQASNGSCYLFHSWADIQEYFDCFGDEAWTRDNKPTEYLLKTMPATRYDVLTRMLEAKGFDKSISDHYTPAMNAAIDGDKHLMLNAATWTSPFVITPNDPDGKGRWAIMEAPGGPYNMGGSSYGIWKDSKNKDAAWKYISWSFLTTAGCESNLTARGWTPPLKAFVETHDYSKNVDPMFAPQNISEKFFVKMAPKVKIRAPEVYMNQIKAAFKVAENAVINDGPAKVTLEKYKEILTQEMKNNCPDLVFN